VTSNFRESLKSYKGESVNRSQMNMKRKTRDIRTWERKIIYFSTYPPPTLIRVPSLCQRVETRSVEVF
jgi:hypothetical protein